MISKTILARGVAGLSWFALASGLLGAAAHSALPPRHRPAPLRHVAIAFENPAGLRAAGPLGTDPFAAVLPSGRFLQPEGKSVLVGSGATALALSPDGRYAVVANAGDATASASDADRGGSLTVVDTRWMIVVDTYRAAAGNYFADVRAIADPGDPNRTLVLAAGGPSGNVTLFALDGTGHLSPDAVPAIVIPPGPDRGAFGGADPTSLGVASGGRTLYVADRRGDDVVAIDLATRRVLSAPAAVGLFPADVAIVAGRLLVTNEGLASYGVLATPAVTPMFVAPEFDALRGSSLASLPLASDGTPSGPASTMQMDPSPDGVRIVGGAHPTAIVATRTGSYAFVAMTNVDRIATVALGDAPHVVGGTELRLYDRGPYGTHPVALALSRDGSRLYVALAGINAIAVLDARNPLRVHRLGLIPTGWSPARLALSRDDRTLFVANAVGIDTRERSGATLERIDLHAVQLRDATRRALDDEHRVHPVRRNAIVPEVLGGRRSSNVTRVVTIFVGSSSYDAVLGDLTDANGRPHGPGDPAFVEFGASVTPNLHALAQTFALAGNFYAEGATPDLAHAYGTAGMPDAFSSSHRFAGDPASAQPDSNDPEDYPRAGYIFNSLAARGLAYRDYGDLLALAGYSPQPPTGTSTLTLGGWYTLDVPALLALRDHVDLQYPGWNARISDAERAKEFVRDFTATTVSQAGGFAYTDVWLPTAVARGDAPSAATVADTDRALGTIVAAITHDPGWKSTAIFVVPDGVVSARDHVDPHRACALVISPYARRHLVGMQHLSTSGVLKTEEAMLGLPALSLGDALASDFGGFFTASADLTPYDAVGEPPSSSE